MSQTVEHHEVSNETLFQHDRASIHTEELSVNILQCLFQSQIITWCLDIACPLNLPELATFGGEGRNVQEQRDQCLCSISGDAKKICHEVSNIPVDI